MLHFLVWLNAPQARCVLWFIKGRVKKSVCVCVCACVHVCVCACTLRACSLSSLCFLMSTRMVKEWPMIQTLLQMRWNLYNQTHRLPVQPSGLYSVNTSTGLDYRPHRPRPTTRLTPSESYPSHSPSCSLVPGLSHHYRRQKLRYSS
jgi:hypothetical protein